MPIIILKYKYAHKSLILNHCAGKPKGENERNFQRYPRVQNLGEKVNAYEER